MPALERVSALKERVASMLREADPSVTVRTTDYFNHTYAPDLVMKWGPERVERRVYLRTTDVESYIEEDINSLGELHPMLIPLAGVSTGADRRARGLEETARRATALVAEPNSIQTLSEAAADVPVVRLATKAFLQGGVGVVDEAEADTFSTAIAVGFDDAARGESRGTSDALRAAELQLDPSRALAVSDFFQAVWIGSGADAMSFPGSASLTPSFKEDALSLLLDTISIDDDEFWGRVARRITLRDLSALTRSGNNTNFQRLVTAALGHLNIKALRMVSDSSSHLEEPVWSAGGGSLQLGVGKARYIFVADSINQFSEEGVERDLSAREFVSAARISNVNVSTLSLEVEDRVVDYSSVDGTSVTDDDRVLNIAESVGRGRVRAAVVSAGLRNLQIHFENSTAYGVTRTQFNLVAALLATLPFFTDTEVKDPFPPLSDGTASAAY